MNGIPKYTKKNLGQCWNCQYQTKECLGEERGKPFEFPFCQRFGMTMSAIFVKQCKWFKERET